MNLWDPELLNPLRVSNDWGNRDREPTFGCLTDGFSDESRGSKGLVNCLRTGSTAMACAAEAAWSNCTHVPVRVEIIPSRIQLE